MGADREIRRKEGEVEGEREKNKERGLPLDKTRGPPLMVLNPFFSQLSATFKLEGLSLVCVQLPKELYMKISTKTLFPPSE
jgi:hypothetical protein